MKVAVVGGGISGLTAAFDLKRDGCTVHLIEAQDRVGGVIRGTARGPYRFEDGPISAPSDGKAFRALCEAVGIADEIVCADPDALERYLYFHGRLRRLPRRFREFLITPLFTWPQKLRVLLEPLIPHRPAGHEETVAEFFGRRVGRGITMTWIDVVVSGVYAGNPNRLGIESAFPQLVRMEEEYGSIFRGARERTRQRRRAAESSGRSSLASFRDGLVRLVAALAAALEDQIHLGRRVAKIERRPDGYRLAIEDARGAVESLEVDKAVLAAPAPVSGLLLSPLAGDVADLLFEIEYVSIAVVQAGFDLSEVPGLPRAYGFLVPRMTRCRTLGWTCYSTLFPDAAPEGKVAMIGFLGGSLDPQAVDLDDGHIRYLMMGELALLLGQRKMPEPEELGIVRWRNAIPQPNVGHRRRMQAARQLLAMECPGLALAGNWVDGVILERSIQSGFDAAQAVRGTPEAAAAPRGAAP